MFNSIAKVNKGVHSKDGVWGRADGLGKDTILKDLENWHSKTHWSMADIEIPVKDQMKYGQYQFDELAGKLCFGFYMGSVYTPFTWYHELAHCLDFINTDESYRLRNHDHHIFKYHQEEIFGNWYNEPTTSQGVHRELRTFAIQLHMLEKDFGLLTDKSYWVSDNVSSLVYLTDFFFIDGDNDKEKFLTCEELLMRYYNNITIENVERLHDQVYNIFKNRVDKLGSWG